MTAAPSLPFPGGRTLAGWWRLLAPRQPTALWVGHLFLHRIEALARRRRPFRPEPFPTLVLHALALELPGPVNSHAPAAVADEQLRRLDGRLHLGRQLLVQVLGGLTRQGLAQGDSLRGWALAATGRQVVELGEVPRECYERLTFAFVQRESSAGGGSPPPAFLAVRAAAGNPWPAGEGRGFDMAALRACLDRPASWKQRHDFPADVAEVLAPEGPPDDVPAWQRVLVDRPEHLLAVLAAVASGRDSVQLLGFAALQEGWALQAAEPVIVLNEDSAAELPELRPSTALQTWRQAWRQWCQQRGFPGNEAEACAVEPAGVSLRVRAGARLLERLRAGRSDALKGEAWLLAGEGRVRAAARVEVEEAGP
jgi:hypothetical protein